MSIRDQSCNLPHHAMGLQAHKRPILDPAPHRTVLSVRNMRLRNLWFLWVVMSAILAVATFAVGFVMGGTFDRYRFFYGAPRRSALRGALARLAGREKFYGQFAQDLWITRGIAPGKRNGYYVDVGSADGEYISNTKLLDDAGWKGVCIDPFPKNMSHRTCRVFRQPVFSESGKHVKFRAAGELGGIEQDLNLHKDEKKVADAPLVEFVTATLDEVLAQAHAPNYIDYINLDVEGAEYDVLRGFSLDRYQFGSMTVEHNYEPAKREAIHKLLASKGYVRVRSWEVDDWYVHPDLAYKYKNFMSFCTGLTLCPEALNQ
jgi:FkbM family methyltransferase